MLNNLLSYFSPLTVEVPFRLRRRVTQRIAGNRELGYVYIRIPKAANSTVTKTLVKYSQEEIASDEDGKNAKSSFVNWTELGCLTSSCLTKKYFTFAFFRNPYSRVLSAFLDKMANGSNQFTKKIAKRIGGQNWSFEEFISYLEKGGLYDDIHWAPQTKICPIPIGDLNFIGKVESIDQDLKYVIEHIFGKESFMGVDKKMVGIMGAADKLDDYYTSDLKKRIEVLYFKDFQLLEYEP